MYFNLDSLKMNVIKTAEQGVVNEDTIFDFKQTENFVSAEYSGGHILKGFLVGTVEGNHFQFNYCQKQIDGKLDNGASICEVTKNENGRIRIIERFEWESRPGETGVNIFEEINK